MKSISPVMPGSESIEVVLGADQPEYEPLPAVYLDSKMGPMITRWRFSPEERMAILRGADVVFTQLTFGNPFQPVNFQVVFPDQQPILVGDDGQS